jgi:stringent starvation protein B
MSGTVSTKPYLMRAIYEWCVDSGFTPYVLVAVDENTRVPMEHVKNGEIVLNISPVATTNLKMDNDYIHFAARFNGASREIIIPVGAVLGIFARENSQGLFFQRETAGQKDEPPTVENKEGPEDGSSGPQKRGKPNLQVVK